MNITYMQTLKQKANELQVTGYKFRDASTTPEAFVNTVAQQLPIDMPPYLREATLEFSKEYGVYPPALIICDDQQAQVKLRDLLDKHSKNYSRKRTASALAEEHELITERLAADTPLAKIAAELNCSLATLRTYCTKNDLIT